jgi:hypothetical protein
MAVTSPCGRPASQHPGTQAASARAATETAARKYWTRHRHRERHPRPKQAPCANASTSNMHSTVPPCCRVPKATPELGLGKRQAAAAVSCRCCHDDTSTLSCASMYHELLRLSSLSLYCCIAVSSSWLCVGDRHQTFFCLVCTSVRACSRRAGPVADHCDTMLQHHLTRDRSYTVQSVITAGPAQLPRCGTVMGFGGQNNPIGGTVSPRLSALPAKGLSYLSGRQASLCQWQLEIVFVSPSLQTLPSLCHASGYCAFSMSSMKLAARQQTLCTAFLMHIGQPATRIMFRWDHVSRVVA